MEVQVHVDLTKDVPGEGFSNMAVTDIKKYLKEHWSEVTIPEAIQLLEISLEREKTSKDSDDDSQVTEEVVSRAFHKDILRYLMENIPVLSRMVKCDRGLQCVSLVLCYINDLQILYMEITQAACNNPISQNI